MIEITEISKRFGSTVAIHRLSFQVLPQGCLALLGQDGAGKTTLLRMISAAIAPSSGSVKVFNSTAGCNNRDIKKLIGYQPERPLRHPTMTVKSFLHYLAEIRGFSGREKHQAVDRALARLELYPTLQYPIDALCTGLKRKVAIAQAILHNPKVLLLDEPNEGLDAHQKARVGRLITSLSEEMAILVASRNPEELSGICNRALVLARGRLAADSTMTELRRSSRYHRAVTLVPGGPLDLLALAVLPGVAGIEEDHRAPGTVTVLALPGHCVYPHVSALIASRGWTINGLTLEPGRLDDRIQHLSKEACH